MGIGKLRCSVVDVEDLAVAEAFYSALTGLEVIPSVFPGRYSYLGRPDPWDHELILHKVSTTKGPDANRGHIDIWVRSVSPAIAEVEAIGGRLKKPPALYPRPGSYPGESPRIDWAVMQDPFGNEFCVITVLTADQVRAVEGAARQGSGDDRHWRAAAGCALSGED